MKKTILTLAATALLLTGLSACGTEKPAEVTKSSTSKSDVVTDEVTKDNDVVEDEPAEDTEPATEDAPPAKLGETAQVGDWAVKVTQIALNANQTIHKANEFNDRPKGQFVLVTFEATYNGAERTADSQSDLTWSLTTSDKKILDSSSQVTPADEQEWAYEARKGGTVKQQVVFDVNPQVLPKSILSVEGYDEEFDSIYADFAL